MKTLADRGIILQEWQQEVFEQLRDRVPRHLPRQSGKTFMSYVINLEHSMRNPNRKLLVPYVTDPDVEGVQRARLWMLGFFEFADRYYPEVKVTASSMSIYMLYSPTISKRQKLHEAVRKMR